MITLTVGEFKAQFSDLVTKIKAGEKIAISYGRAKKIVAYLVAPTDELSDRKLGQLKQKGKIGKLKKIDSNIEFGI
jgi:antitoxin (DNA-binding transcriptional repressor) of toxin-antitoxin stability system